MRKYAGTNNINCSHNIYNLLCSSSYCSRRNFPGQIFTSEVAIFGVAFIGFLVFFISEHAAFIIHFGMLALVSLLIAFNLRFEVRTSLPGAVLFSVALMLHFFGMDRTMEIHYSSLFNRYGRYILSIMPLTGWALSVLFPEKQSEAAVLLAFIAGAVLFNVIKDEVPGAEKGEPKFFVAGSLIYGGS